MRYRLRFVGNNHHILLQVNGKKHLFVGALAAISEQETQLIGSECSLEMDHMKDMITVSFDEARPNLFAPLLPLLQAMENERVEKDRRDNETHIFVPCHIKGSIEGSYLPTARTLKSMGLTNNYPSGSHYVVTIDRRKQDEIFHELRSFNIPVGTTTNNISL